MATPPDNSGKPPAPPPGLPRISPVTPETPGRTDVTIPQVAPQPPRSAAPPGVPGPPKITAPVAATRPPAPASATPGALRADQARGPPVASPQRAPPQMTPQFSRANEPPAPLAPIAPSIPTVAPLLPPRIETKTQPLVLPPRQVLAAPDAPPPRIDPVTQPAGVSPLFAPPRQGPATAVQPAVAPAGSSPMVAPPRPGPATAVQPGVTPAGGSSQPGGGPAARIAAPPGVPRPAGAPGSVPRPMGAPGAAPRPPGAPAPAMKPAPVLAPPPPTVPMPPPTASQDFTETATVLDAIVLDTPEAITLARSRLVAPPVAPAAAATVTMPVLPPLQRRAAIPETGAVEQITPQQAAELKRLFEAFVKMDYFQVLQLAPTATTSEIKRAFYKESRIYHPDRIFHLTDAGAKQHLGDIYKRITEAYYVLRDDAKRKKYLADLAGPERVAKLRFTEASEVEQKNEVVKAREEEFGTNSKARQFFKTGLADINSQKWDSAERNIKMALTFEPSNARFKEKLAEVQVELEKIRKATHTGFTIK